MNQNIVRPLHKQYRIHVPRYVVAVSCSNKPPKDFPQLRRVPTSKSRHFGPYIVSMSLGLAYTSLLVCCLFLCFSCFLLQLNNNNPRSRSWAMTSWSAASFCLEFHASHILREIVIAKQVRSCCCQSSQVMQVKGQESCTTHLDDDRLYFVGKEKHGFVWCQFRPLWWGLSTYLSRGGSFYNRIHKVDWT